MKDQTSNEWQSGDTTAFEALFQQYERLVFKNAYLMTVSLTQPIDSDWIQIYLYVAGKTCEKWRINEPAAAIPADIRVDSLNGYQVGELKRFKSGGDSDGRGKSGKVACS